MESNPNFATMRYPTSKVDRRPSMGEKKPSEGPSAEVSGLRYKLQDFSEKIIPEDETFECDSPMFQRKNSIVTALHS